MAFPADPCPTCPRIAAGKPPPCLAMAAGHARYCQLANPGHPAYRPDYAALVRDGDAPAPRPTARATKPRIPLGTRPPKR